jgi:hypothetical protein
MSNSRSLHIESNGSRELYLRDGLPAGETVLTKDGFIHRFIGGLLDGDYYLKDGSRAALPAVEGPGHLEFWREGKLHLDNKLPAVYSNGFRHKEWWENGKLIKEEESVEAEKT